MGLLNYAPLNECWCILICFSQTDFSIEQIHVVFDGDGDGDADGKRVSYFFYFLFFPRFVFFFS
jgi:hypothetical protein